MFLSLQKVKVDFLTLSYPASENSSQHRGGAIIAPPLILMLGDSDPVETLDT